MTRSARWLVLGVGLIAAAWLSSQAWHGRATGASPPASSIAASGVTTDAGMLRVGAVATRPVDPFASTGLRMRSSPTARLDLARQLRACAELRELTPAAIARRQEELADQWRLGAPQMGRVVDEPALRAQTDEAIARRLAEKRGCARFPDAAITHWLRWQEAAAVGGSDDAKREFAQAVIRGSQDADALFQDIDAFARRKRVAFGLLEEVLAHHDCSVSAQLLILAPDATTRYAYYLVNFDWGRAIQPGIASPEVAAQNIAFMQRKLDEQAAGLSATQRAQARARAEAAYARCR